jgi:hypothetical protein
VAITTLFLAFAAWYGSSVVGHAPKLYTERESRPPLDPLTDLSVTPHVPRSCLPVPVWMLPCQ